MPKEYYEAQTEAKRNTWLLFFVFGLLIIMLGITVGYVWFGDWLCGVIFVSTIGIVWSVVTWFQGDKMILKMSGARKVYKKDYAYLYNVTEGLALAAGVPAPEVYIIKDDSPNAFATGRDPEHSSIAVTTGLLKMMDRAELEGVVAHEMSHIRNYDIRTMMVA